MLRQLDNRKPGVFAARFRRKRIGLFSNLLRHRFNRPVRILDAGGNAAFWLRSGLDKSLVESIVTLNLIESDGDDFITSIVGDVQNMQFRDNEFDMVFSNSLIEHVGMYEDQRQAAQEIRRVGRFYFVQTPNRHFPIEPHYLLPFVQYLPIRWRVPIVQHFNLARFVRRKNTHLPAEAIQNTRLLTAREMRALFPGCTLVGERFAGLTKSLVAHNLA